MLEALAGPGMSRALSEAHKSLEEGGIPIGAALVGEANDVVAVGHNQRVQRKSAILHAEIDCLSNAGRRSDYSDTVLYSTLMPCYMCAGAIIQFGIPRVVVGDAHTFSGAGDLLREHGVDVVDLDDPECRTLLRGFIAHNPEIWREDIGE